MTLILLVNNKWHDFQVELCNIKKERAEQLLSALGGEKTRWTENARHLAQVYIKLTGLLTLIFDIKTKN